MVTKGSTYFISVGSTVPDSEEKITQVLRTHFPEGTLSSYTYSKDATGHTDTMYTNAVLRVESVMPLGQLKMLTKVIEKEMGRDHNDPTHVALDLDVVVKDKEILRPKDYGRAYFHLGYSELGGIDLVEK